VAAFALPKSARLRSRAEYLAIRQEGKSFVDGPLAASFRPRDSQPTRPGIPGGVARVGLTVSSKVGGAVTRNRIKRRLREAVRLELAGVPAVDLVIVARATAAEGSVAEFRAWLRRAAARIAQEAPR
jgi:ribonuclease P protein component